MGWIELTFKTDPTHAKLLSDLLEQNGALAVTFQDAENQPIYEPELNAPLWDNTCVTGLFAQEQDLKKVLAIIVAQYDKASYEIKQLTEQDWEKVWMQDFTPMSFAKRLWVIPSHHQTKEPYPFQVVLDPGLAFGTGKHPTTALCLEWLAENIVGQETVIDYGCGSGILGIAAIKLGAKKVYALDNDPQAIFATKENALKNGITEEIITLAPDNLTKQSADIVIANILAKPLISLKNHFLDLIAINGRLVLSGILQDQAKEVIAAYCPTFEILNVAAKEDWVRIDGIRRK